jgi:hypothetical protein
MERMCFQFSNEREVDYEGWKQYGDPPRLYIPPTTITFLAVLEAFMAQYIAWIFMSVPVRYA